SESEWLQNFMPSQIEVRRANLALGYDGKGMRVSGLAFSASGVGPGTIEVDSIEIDQPWLKRTFVDVRGATAMQDTKITITNFALENGFNVETFATDLAG